MTDAWIDAREAARRLGVKPETLYSYVSRGLLHRRRHEDGRRSLFDPVEVDALRRRAGGEHGHSELAFESAVTALGHDRPYYRGHDATVLARRHSFESVAELLWTGQVVEPAPQWPPLADAVEAARRALVALPAGALALDRLQLIVTALAVTDPMRFNLSADAVVATGRTLIASMVDALPPASRRRMARSATVAERLWTRLTPAPPDPSLVRALDVALVLLADHELAASTVAARVAASVTADPYAVVSAALGVVSGPMHGGASLGAERMLAEAADDRDVTRVIGERLRRGERIPGVGHQVYKSGDARADVLFDVVRRAAPRHPTVRVATAMTAELVARGLPAVNADFALATLTTVAGMPVGSGQAVFAVARTAGWIAHAVEEYARHKPLRPRATYVGPAPSDTRQ